MKIYFYCLCYELIIVCGRIKVAAKKSIISETKVCLTMKEKAIRKKTPRKPSKAVFKLFFSFFRRRNINSLNNAKLATFVEYLSDEGMDIQKLSYNQLWLQIWVYQWNGLSSKNWTDVLP